MLYFADFVDFDTFAKSDFRAVKVLACEAVPKSKKLLKFTLNDGTGKDRTILSGIHAFLDFFRRLCGCILFCKAVLHKLSSSEEYIF